MFRLNEDTWFGISKFESDSFRVSIKINGSITSTTFYMSEKETYYLFSAIKYLQRGSAYIDIRDDISGNVQFSLFKRSIHILFKNTGYQICEGLDSPQEFYEWLFDNLEIYFK